MDSLDFSVAIKEKSPAKQDDRGFCFITTVMSLREDR